MKLFLKVAHDTMFYFYSTTIFQHMHPPSAMRNSPWLRVTTVVYIDVLRHELHTVRPFSIPFRSQSFQNRI